MSPTPAHSSAAPAAGPLRVLPGNPRYFTDGSGRAVLLVGAHTWANLQDSGFDNPPHAFDYESYLDFLQANHHNFFRLWAWEQARWASWVTADYYFSPGPPYRRPGPGLALDGRPRFDLDQLDPAYFARLRSRVQEAGRRGIYVSVMLFNGWSIDAEHDKLQRGNPWHGHPFNRANNVNRVDGDPDARDSGARTHQLAIPRVTEYQDVYVRRVIDAVGDLDNVLFEISNESYSDSRDWQYHMIELIHSYEAQRPKQHPVGMSQYEHPGVNADLFEGPADWIAPWEELPAWPYRSSPPDSRGRKVIIVDTDHLWGLGGDRSWAWKSFTRGNQVSVMDPYDGQSIGVGSPPTWDPPRPGWKLLIKHMLHRPETSDWNPDQPKWVALRANLGYIRRFADRMDLAHAEPDSTVSSTGYALVGGADGLASEYLVYAESSARPITVDLSHATGMLEQDWFDPASGRSVAGPPVAGGAVRNFHSPFPDDAVLYLYTLNAAQRGAPERIQ